MSESQTIRKLRWVLLVSLALTLAYLFRLGFFSYAVYALVGVVLLSRAMGHYALVGVEQTRICTATRAKLGETFRVSVEVRNKKALPVPWLLMEDTVPERLPREGDHARVVYLRGGQAVSLSYQLTCTHRGYHQVGPLLLESGDLFGLVRRFQTGAEANYVLVHPKVIPIARYGVATNRPVGEVRIQRKIFEDPARLVGIREYQPGDRLTRVHWRATARTGRLQSKVYEPSTMVGALVALDFYEPAYEDHQTFVRSELGVVAAASIANYVCDQKQQVGFLSNGRDAADRVQWERPQREVSSRAEARALVQMLEESDRLRPVEVEIRRGEEQNQLILDALARLELSDGLPFHEMLRNEYHRLPREAAFVALVPHVPPPLVGVLAEMKRWGFIPTVFVLRNHAGLYQAQAVLAREGIPVYHIDREEDLHAVAMRRF